MRFDPGKPLGIWQTRGSPTWRKGVLRYDPCSYCGARSTTVDHIVPKANGGEHGHTNLAAACSKCNQRKADTPLLEYLLTRRPNPPL